MEKCLKEYRSAELAHNIAGEIREIPTRDMTIMEVCGGHTMAIRKHGIHKLVGERINLISGPGCPVCVTSIKDVDKAVFIAGQKNHVVCTFGDMFYVPGTDASLADCKRNGRDIRIVYSAHDVLEFARKEPEKNFVFLSIGFETTTPTSAAAIREAYREGIPNFKVLALNKTMPEALRAVLAHEDCRVDALICPGHVSTITGTDMYRFIVDELGIGCCISGFEPIDLLISVMELATMIESGKPRLVNAYQRAVLEEGNLKALEIMYDVFEPVDAEWRGVGVIPSSGLGFRDEYAAFDIENELKIEVSAEKQDHDCICGDILRGIKTPPECSLFKEICVPDRPMGACMVSSEGACAAWYKYGV